MKKHISSNFNGQFRLALVALLMAFASVAAAQAPSKVVTDTTEVIVGNKLITITVDSASGKKDVQVRTLEKNNDAQASTNDSGDNGNNDPNENKGEPKKIKKVDVQFFNMDLGTNFLFTGKDSAGVPLPFEIDPLRSTHVGLHFFKTRFNMAKGHVALVTAIDLDNNRYQFRKNITLVPDRPNVTVVNDSIDFKKNKLIVWHAQIPLLLSFHTNPSHPKKDFHISLGGFAGLTIAANTKQKSSEAGKVKRDDDFNLNPFRYGLTARVGYRNLEIYSNYTLTPFFKDDYTNDITSVNFGLSLTGVM